MWQVLNYVQNELLADMSSLRLEVLVIELGIGEDADAKEGDIVLTANKGCRGCLQSHPSIIIFVSLVLTCKTAPFGVVKKPAAGASCGLRRAGGCS